MSGHAKHVGVADSQVTKLNGDVNFSREAIFSEVREVNEREKRTFSIILRGFDCNSVSAVRDKFKGVCQVLNVDTVELSDVVKIGDRKLFHAKVLDEDKRRELLAVANRLKSKKGFENLYIQKDLAYRQRQELSERRLGGNVTKVLGTRMKVKTAAFSLQLVVLLVRVVLVRGVEVVGLVTVMFSQR